MTLRIARRWPTTKSTIGQLYIEWVYQCDSLEDRLRRDPIPSTAANEGKVYGTTAIPAGHYQIVFQKPERSIWSPRADGQLPLLLNVPGYTVIFIHAFNDPTETLGCIAPGARDLAMPDRINGSRIALTPLVQKIDEGLRAGEVWIDIETFCEIPEDEVA